MKTYKYQDSEGEYSLTEEEILQEYFDHWSKKMVKAGKSSIISEKNCIDDWVIVHWAREVVSNV